MRKQAERWGAELYQEDVESIDVKTRPFTVESSERKVIYCFAQVLFLGICNFQMLVQYYTFH